MKVTGLYVKQDPFTETEKSFESPKLNVVLTQNFARRPY